MNVFLWNARARNGHVKATLNHPFPAQVFLGLHRASPRDDRDFTLACGALLDVEDVAGDSIPLFDDEREPTGISLTVDAARVCAKADFERDYGSLRRDAVLIYEKRNRAAADDGWGAFFGCAAGDLTCSLDDGDGGGVLGCASDAVCDVYDQAGDPGDDGRREDDHGAGGPEPYYASALCGHMLGPEYEDETAPRDEPDAEPALEIEREEAPASVLEAKDATDGWARLGCTVPLDADSPKDHVPKPASLDLTYGAFRRSDEPGQVVKKDWHISVDADTDRNGWSYGGSLRTDKWNVDPTAARPYRRQIWHRYVTRPLVAHPVLEASLPRN